MSLFQKSVEKKYLNELDSSLVDKKFNDFQSYFGDTEIQENIRNLKEEEFQEGFIRELFVNILNYTLKPTPEYNIVLEKKNVQQPTWTQLKHKLSDIRTIIRNAFM
jgi:hypothetical protein